MARGADTVSVAQLGEFAEVIDARSPGEFAEDHIPGARNHPTLDDAERAAVGTINAERSAFEAKRYGAVLAARNIARHIETEFATRPPTWRPLIYCWRGGKRSRALTLVLREVGWPAAQLEGGYKAFRRHVIDELETSPLPLRLITVCGETGSAKSSLLAALAKRGAQVLDLEELAAHRGSVLGENPDQPQPAQKMFETRVWDKLRHCVATQPVFVESESKRIGQLQVPDVLLRQMRAGECLRIEAPVAERVRFLLNEYAHFVRDPAHLRERVDCLRGLYSNEVLARWHDYITAGAWPEFVTDLLEHHYDPAYRRSMARNFAGLATAPLYVADDLSGEAIATLAATIQSRAVGRLSRVKLCSPSSTRR